MASTVSPVPPVAVDHFLARSDDAAILEKSVQRLGKWRRTVGLTMTGVVVLLWTASNFLASAVLADNTYSKPFLLVYVNTAFFILPLLPVLVMKAYRHPEEIRQWRDELDTLGRRSWACISRRRRHGAMTRPSLGRVRSLRRRQELSNSQQLLLGDRGPSSQHLSTKTYPDAPERLTLIQTTRLSSEFCILWFLANYFYGASLQHTTVASSTIIASTASVFTLGFGVLAKVEQFTIRKFLGVLVSLAGIVLISSIDLSGENSDSDYRGTFPAKSYSEIATGDGMALLTAILYGVYSVFMKKRIADESAVNMPLFFGLVGLINVLFLWPGFFILHWTGIEPFEMLPAGKVTTIVLLNALASCVADLAWGYAVLMISPIVVTLGLSMTIPLSLIGQVILNSQTASLLYWFGAIMVVASFLFVNHEADKDERILPKGRGGVMSHDASIGDDS